MFFRQPGSTNTDASSSRITTLSGQGVGKKLPAAQYDYVMIHSSEPPPSKQEGEIHMTRDPIAAKKYPGFHDFHECCRVDLGIVYPIAYSNRVVEVGFVKKQSLRKLLRYRDEIHEFGKRGRQPRWG